ncbi:MAG TPA: ImmA/IrrE family metallo-endopeptidase [Kiritimatiellia bacterium]|nr:ImmA/IrrE family metallo-endopeptidase [Kiritimatiellia bacterium]
MNPGPSISINPTLLSWARSESGYDVERVAHRLKVKEERVLAWETGELHPTTRQLQDLAQFLHRPMGVFFMPRPPQTPPLAAEYRRLPGVEVGHESPELRLALRQMIARRETTLNLLGEFGDTPVEFNIQAHLHESPATVGQRLREAVGISLEAQQGWGDGWEAWREWRQAIENMGVLVFQFAKVPLTEVRGLSLLRMPLPVAAINSKEIVPEARIFTVLHEVVHLMLAAGREEAPAAREPKHSEAWEQVERFAENAAAHALMPDALVQGLVQDHKLSRVDWTIDDIRGLARRMRVTPLATATRLREGGFMTWDQYRRWRGEWEAIVSKLPARAGGFATPVQKTIGRAGSPFVRLVLEVLDTGRITAVEASRHLDLKFQHFETLREKVAYGANREAIGE